MTSTPKDSTYWTNSPKQIPSSKSSLSMKNNSTNSIISTTTHIWQSFLPTKTFKRIKNSLALLRQNQRWMSSKSILTHEDSSFCLELSGKLLPLMSMCFLRTKKLSIPLRKRCCLSILLELIRKNINGGILLKKEAKLTSKTTKIVGFQPQLLTSNTNNLTLKVKASR